MLQRKTPGTLLLVLLLLLLPALALAGPVVNKINKRVAKGNDDEAISIAEDYLSKKPDGREAPEVQALLEHMLFQKAESDGSERALLSFVERFPNSSWVPTARQAAARERWKTVRSTDTRQAYLEFLRAYPESVHAADATQREDDRAWQQAITDDSTQAYYQYQTEHPLGRYGDKARKLEKNRAITEARTTNDPKKWAWMATRWPNEPEGSQARWQVLRLTGRAHLGGLLEGRSIGINSSLITTNWTSFESLPVGTPITIDLGLDWPADTQPQIELLAALKSGTGPVELIPPAKLLRELTQRMDMIAPPPMTQLRIARVSPSKLQFLLPMPLKRDPGNARHDGFAIRLTAPEQEALLIPLRLNETYPAENGAQQLLLYLDQGDLHSFDPAKENITGLGRPIKLAEGAPIEAILA